MVFLFLLTGVRVGELAGIEGGDVELGARSGTLRIRADVAKGARELRTRMPRRKVRAILPNRVRAGV